MQDLIDNQIEETEDAPLQMKCTEVFEKNWNANTRLVLNEGGSRSSKTMSIAQTYVIALLQAKGEIMSVIRRTLPALKATVMRDVVGLLKEYGIYDEHCHNKTDNIYTHTYSVEDENGEIHTYTNELEFFACDDEQKVRGRKRHRAWLNEANEMNIEEFRQIAMRTSGTITLDYNPTDEYHWIETDLKVRKDITVIHSTYKDNPFLEQAIIDEIEQLEKADENYWRVFGLGLKPINGTRVFSHWKLCDALPEDCDEYVYGVDFGFNNATAIVKIGIKDGVYYWQELFYQSHHTNAMLIEVMNQLVNDGKITKDMRGVGDTEDPNRIREIQEAGFNMEKADKEAGSVKGGIDHIKSHEWYITKDSLNTLDNAKNYMWKTKGSIILDEPVKANDHALDAGRMAIWTFYGTTQSQTVGIRHL